MSAPVAEQTVPDCAYGPVQMFIDGEWTDGTSGRSEPILNPATGAAIGTVPHASEADLDRALLAAQRAFPAWRDTPAAERARILHRAANLLRARADEIGLWMTMEQGKPLAEARAEAFRVAGPLDWEAEEARRAYGRIIPFDADTELTVIHQPIGPVAGFTPWNFPAFAPMRKLSGAVSAGCSIVLKASEETPATACALVRAFQEAGVPDGVVNLVFGVPAEISEKLIASPVIRLLAFTGSVPVGKHLATLAAARMKPSVMELGGHAPVVVCADADPEKAARLVAQDKFANAGQICTAPSRLFVHESIADAFTRALVAAAEALKVGDGRADGTTMGPLANDRRLQAIGAFVDEARDRGANVVTGGARIGSSGCFYAPTVLEDVPADARLLHDEPFGPVAPIIPFTDLGDAIAAANSLPYGLAAYGFTERSDTADVLKRGLEAGIISINHCRGPIPEAPSGGLKESGYGKEGGTEGLHGYMVTKRVSHKLR